MNDFTKEELQELLLGYEMHQHNHRHNWPSRDLVKKLQSLIDNYCDHIWTEGSGNHLFCGKCHVHGGKK